MGSCYSNDHIARDHIHTDIITHNIEEPQQKYRPGKISNRLLAGVGWGGRGWQGALKLVLLDPNPAPAFVVIRNYLIRRKVS